MDAVAAPPFLARYLQSPFKKTCAVPVGSVLALAAPVPYRHAKGAFNPLFRPRGQDVSAKAWEEVHKLQSSTGPGVYEFSVPNAELEVAARRRSSDEEMVTGGDEVMPEGEDIEGNSREVQDLLGLARACAPLPEQGGVDVMDHDGVSDIGEAALRGREGHLDKES